MGGLRYVGVKDWSDGEVEALRAELVAAAAARGADFASVERFVVFVGYPRSGHSLVGSLLDAHPQAAIAHEMDILRFVAAGFDRDLLFHLLLENVREFTAAGREWTDYRYDVPGGWQGRTQGALRVIGDKKGGRSTRRLDADPALLPRLLAAVGVPVRFVHVVRNPYDNIATRDRRKATLDLPRAADLHFGLARAVARLKERIDPASILDLRHDDLVADPREALTRLCTFLDLPAPDAYLDACAAVVHPTPRRSRDEAAWPPGLVDDIARRMERFDFFAGYGFE